MNCTLFVHPQRVGVGRSYGIESNNNFFVFRRVSVRMFLASMLLLACHPCFVINLVEYRITGQLELVMNNN